MNILRARMDDLDIKALGREILEQNADITFLRIPCENLPQIPKLTQLGYPYYQTDTLVYYYVDFDKYQPQPLRNSDLEFVPARQDDADLLGGLVERIFPGYTNHYNTNPFIEKQNILEGYKEWVIDFIGQQDKFVFLVNRSGESIGFATCSVADGEAEGVLYGVLPEASGGGVYSDIIRYTQAFMKERGINRMKVSTQVQNYAVQKVWSREGFHLAKSYATLHINSLLQYTLLRPIEFDMTISDDDVRRCEALSGDSNPVHFIDEYAQKLGFRRRISHGLIANSEMSKYFGMDFPGNGTLFMSYYYKFLRPLYTDEKYRVRITTPFFDASRNIYLCLVRIFDSEGNVCLLSYNDLIKK